jgi:molybdopterin converting factor small subunit
VAVNHVLMGHRQGRKTRLSDGDTLTFVKAAAGG